jgi:hypothetical protein
MSRRWTAVVLFVTVTAAALACPRDAGAIPAFARRYGISCAQCHEPIPKLTAFGEMFAGHGFRMGPGEQPADTVETGDELLALGRSLPLAIRFDAHVQAYGDGPPESDFQAPFGLKLLSSAPLSPSLSYYFYFFLAERGEVGGVEDAFVMWNDVGGTPLDLSFGQFQVSDPLFKRELRLMFDDYAAYRARMGDQRADLTYDRGFLAMLDWQGFTITGEMVNGNGKNPADGGRFDDDPNKNLFGHVTRDIVPGLRLGAMGYWGRQDPPSGFVPPPAIPARRNEFWYAGADATVDAGPLQLNGQFLHRRDDSADFLGTESNLDGGFVEALWIPPAERWYAFALWNRLTADLPVLDPRMGGPAGVDRYHAISGGVGWLVRRNARAQVEGWWDFVQEEMRWTVSTTIAH